MGYMSAEDAASQLGVTPTQIRDLYRRGELNGKRHNGILVIDQESVLARASGEVSKPLDPQAAWDAALAMEECARQVLRREDECVCGNDVSATLLVPESTLFQSGTMW